jgi:hypothetical protein
MREVDSPLAFRPFSIALAIASVLPVPLQYTIAAFPIDIILLAVPRRGAAGV